MPSPFKTKERINMETLKTADVAKITGRAGRTVQQYAERIGVAYTGTGKRKEYHWTAENVESFKTMLAALKPAGRPPKSAKG